MYKHYSIIFSKVYLSLSGHPKAMLYSIYFYYIWFELISTHQDLLLVLIHRNIFSMLIRELQPLYNYECCLRNEPFLNEQDKIYGTCFSCLVTFQIH